MIEIFRLAARNGADLAVDQAVSGGVVDDRGAEFEEAEAQEAVDEGPEGLHEGQWTKEKGR